ncbi:glycosyltransferase family 2 protein [Salsipaludibacter albus]|uniref:glycosyltransferase family 2 protein n=1 Tax=Salsipaludibacter albus TaxID=2849650 RepID=UPI001EE3F210|nr:glycosyltransferase family 2 protein [Salsipaludibacter albus]MBY5161215.1 glycosyltransferase [Salsipaludibacter albus]
MTSNDPSGSGATSPPPASAPDLSVVIPVHDAGSTIEHLAQTLLATDGLRVQVVLVDDASTDDTAEVLRDLASREDAVVALFHDTNAGAGVARNTGFDVAEGRYTLFFDADDIVHPAALGAAVRALDDTGADLVVLPYDYRRGDQPDRTGMNTFDHETWALYVGTTRRRVGTLATFPRLLGFSNYPWNKVLRTETYRRAGLRFGTTPVHNDILGHWYTLLFADSIVLLDEKVCTHVVESSGTNISNDRSEARLTLFAALDETYDLLEAHPDLRRRYAHHYWSLVVRVSDWASGRLDSGHRVRFDALLQDHLLRIDLGDYTRIRCKHDPALADSILSRALT